MPQTLDGTVITHADYQARLLQSIPASYVVWKDGTQAKAECLLKGGTDYTTGTDATIIQNALDGLTAGRTWKEKIVLKGDYTIDTCISVPSYMIMEILGKQKLANNATIIPQWASMFSIYNESHVEIHGGIFDGNKTFNAGGGPLIEAKTCTDILYSGIVAHDSPHDGLLVRNSSRVLVKGCISYENTKDGIGVQGGEGPSTDVIVEDCICYSNGRAGICTDGIYVGTQNENITLSGNICHSQTGVTSIGGGIVSELSKYVLIDSCQAYNNKAVGVGTNTGWGIIANYSDKVSILNCTAHDNDASGIYLTNTTIDSIIASCINYNNGLNADAAARDGITLYLQVDNCIITGNRIRNHPNYEIKIVDNTCDKNLILGNILLGTHTGTISDSGTGTVKEHNIEA